MKPEDYETMNICQVDPDNADHLYTLWSRLNQKGRYSDDKSRDEFLHRYFQNPSVESRCYLGEEDENKLGAVLLEIYGWGIYLYDWIEKRETYVFEEFFDHILDSIDENDTIILAPHFGRDEGVDGWKDLGFSNSEEAPYNLLMKRDLSADEDLEGIDVGIDILADPAEKEMIEQLASLLTKISSRWDDKKTMEKNICWELEDKMIYYLASKEGKPIGYCGMEKRELVSGDEMNWIRELGVIPKGRGEGVATELIIHALKRSIKEGRVEIYIDTHSENPAVDLYKRLGFQVIESVPNLVYDV